MVHEMTGDLLSCDADYICHQTNFYGVMGAGVAASIHSKLLSPAAYSAYQRLCRKMGRDLLGEVQYLPGTAKEPGGRSYIVFNLFCQDDRAQADRGLTRYDCMRSCLKQVEHWARENGCKRVALPGNMGCGIAGGDWRTVRQIIEDVFSKSPVPCTIVWWKENAQ